MKKHSPSPQDGMEDFLPASDAEKAYMVRMRPSTTFFRDGMKRLLRNKVATVSMVVIVLITLAAIVIPFSGLIPMTPCWVSVPASLWTHPLIIWLPSSMERRR